MDRAGKFGLIALLCLSACSTADKEEPAQVLVSSPKTEELVLIDRALANYDRGLYEIARETLEELRDGYPSSPYAVLAELKVADSHMVIGDYSSAIVGYEEFIRLHPGHEAIPYVRYQIGKAYLEQYRDEGRDQSPLHEAQKAFGQLVKTAPRSPYATTAKRHVTRAGELLAEHEAHVAEFYLEQEMYDAAFNRYDKLVEKYGQVPAAKRVGTKLAAALEGMEDLSAKLYVKLDSLREVSDSETLQDAPKPPAPAVVLARASGPTSALPVVTAVDTQAIDEPVFVRARLAESPKETAYRGIAIPSVLTDLSCEQNDDESMVFVAKFREPIELRKEYRSSDDSVEAIVVQEFELPKKLPRAEPAALTCNAGQAQIWVEENRNASPTEFKISLKLRPEANYSLFALDRPYRIMAVVK